MSTGPGLDHPLRRLAVVDDDDITREALRRLLPARLRTEIAARSVEEFLARGRVAIDLVVLDLRLTGTTFLHGGGGPVLQGTRAIRILAGERGHRVLLYTNEVRRPVLAACFAAGAMGLAHKAEPLDRLIAAIDTVAEGGVAVTPAVAGMIRKVLERREGPVLTSREADVVRLAASGLPHLKIGQRLGISLKTVEAHLWNVTRKFSQFLADHSIAQLAHEFGITEGDLVAPSEPNRVRRQN